MARGNDNTMTPEKPQSPEGKPEFGPAEEEFYRMERDKLQEQKTQVEDIEDLSEFIKGLVNKYRVGEHPGTSVTMGTSLEQLRDVVAKEEELARGRGSAEIHRLNRISRILSLLKDETVVRPETANVRDLLLETEKQLRRDKAALKRFEKGLEPPPQ